MKNIFESLHLRSKPKTPRAQTVSTDGGPSEDWEGTQVTLSGWKSLLSGDLKPLAKDEENVAPVEQIFEGFGAGAGNNVDLAGLPTRTSEDMDFLLDDLDINSTAPSSPAISYHGENFFAEGVEIQSPHGFLGGPGEDYGLQGAMALQEGTLEGEGYQHDKNRALAELFGGNDSAHDGLEHLLSSFQATETETRGSAPAPPYEDAFYEAKPDTFLDQLLSPDNKDASVASPFQVNNQVNLPPCGNPHSPGMIGSLTPFDPRDPSDLAKYQDSLPRISTLPPGLGQGPRPPSHPPLPTSPQSGSSSPDNLCQKIASALVRKGVKPNGLALQDSKPQNLKPQNPGLARSAPTSPPETPRFRAGKTSAVLRRTKSQNVSPAGSPRALSPAPAAKGRKAPSPNGTSPSPSSVLASGQRSPKRKDNPVVRIPSSKRLNGAPEKSAQSSPNRTSGGVAKSSGGIVENVGVVKSSGAVAQSSEGPLKSSISNFGAVTLRVNAGEPVRNGLYYDEEGVPHWKGPAPKKGEAGYMDYLRYRQFLSAKARDKKAALQRIEKESHVRLQGTVETLDEQLEVLVLKLQQCLSHQHEEVPLRDILHAAESMKQQVRQSLDWRQEQEAQLLDQIEKGQGSAEDVGEDDKATDSEEPDLNSWL